MKVTLFLLLLSISSLSPSGYSTSDPGIDEILDKHAKAMGGKKSWKKLKSYILYQKRPNGSEVIAYAKKPDQFKLHFKTKDKELIKSFDGKKGWLLRDGEYEAMRPGEEIEMAEEPEFYEELIFAREEGYKVELLGKEEWKGKEVYKILLAKSEEDQQLYWLNAQTFLIELTGEYSQDSAHEGIYYKTSFSDYREVESLLFPFYLELIPNDGEPIPLPYYKIEVNPKIKDSIFRYSAP